MAVFRGDYASPLGKIVLASDGQALTGLWFEGQKYFPPAAMISRPSLPAFAAARTWLDGYFAGERAGVSALPLAPAGSDFQKLIWSLLAGIPYGQTTTYGALAGEAARRLGRASMSAQAVGGAVGHNPISLIIPCHRVLGADGSLTGYAGGLARKRWLLRHEGAAIGDGRKGREEGCI